MYCKTLILWPRIDGFCAKLLGATLKGFGASSIVDTGLECPWFEWWRSIRSFSLKYSSCTRKDDDQRKRFVALIWFQIQIPIMNAAFGHKVATNFLALQSFAVACGSCWTNVSLNAVSCSENYGVYTGYPFILFDNIAAIVMRDEKKWWRVDST